VEKHRRQAVDDDYRTGRARARHSRHVFASIYRCGVFQLARCQAAVHIYRDHRVFADDVLRLFSVDQDHGTASAADQGGGPHFQRRSPDQGALPFHGRTGTTGECVQYDGGKAAGDDHGPQS